MWTIGNQDEAQYVLNVPDEDVPVPVITVGAVHMPFSWTREHEILPPAVHLDRKNNKELVRSFHSNIERGDPSYRPLVKLRSRRVFCVEKGSAEMLAQVKPRDVHFDLAFEPNQSSRYRGVWTKSITNVLQFFRKPKKNNICIDEETTFSISFDTKGFSTKRSPESRSITLPLHYALEMMADNPNRYMLLAQIEEEKKNLVRMNGCTDVAGLHVYTIPGLKVVQFGEKGQVPVEYVVAVMSQHHMHAFWENGRDHLTHVALSQRNASRIEKWEGLHAKAASLVAKGDVPVGPVASSQHHSEDEFGIDEPPEVKELAAELGIGEPVRSSGSKPPSLSSGVVTFGATILCGAISITGSGFRAIAGLFDQMIVMVPILNRVLIPSLPPRSAKIERKALCGILKKAYESNEKLWKDAQLDAGDSVNVDKIGERLAMSSLWMAITAKLLARQYLFGSVGSLILSQSNAQESGPFVAPLSSGDNAMREVISQLIGSLESNDFVQRASKALGSEGLHNRPSILNFEDVISLHSGMSIEYKRRSAAKKKDFMEASAPAGKGIILIGDLETGPLSPSIMQLLSPRSDGIASSVMDGRNLLPSSRKIRTPSP